MQVLRRILKILEALQTKNQLWEDSIPVGLTFDDVILAPRHVGQMGLPDVDLSTNLAEGLRLNTPFISAAMDTITEARTAEVMALAGGAGVIHCNLSQGRQVEEVAKVKRALNIIIKNPYTYLAGDKIKKVRDDEKVRKVSGQPISGFPIVDNNRQLLGILTKTDRRSADDDDSVEAHMTPLDPESKTVITADNINDVDRLLEEAERIFKERKIERIPLVNSSFQLVALITFKDFQKRERYPNAARDKNGCLIVGAAVKDDFSEAGFKHIADLVNAGLDFLVIDKAHGDSDCVVSTIKAVKSAFRNIPLVAGNVAIADAALLLLNAGADIVKVGMGAGSICTTRNVTGSGLSQFSAIHYCAKAAKAVGKTVIADGGIRYAGDIIKALAVGATAVMMGRIFAATDEVPGEIQKKGEEYYKVYRGMGSKSVLKESPSRYLPGSFSGKLNECAPEGVECLVRLRGSLWDVIEDLRKSLRQGFFNQGSINVAALQNNPRFCRVTHAGIIEGHPHDIENIIG